MKSLLLYLVYYLIKSQIIEILTPESLRLNIQSIKKETGILDSSISTFGKINFDQNQKMQMLIPPKDNRFGCEILENPKIIQSDVEFAWLLERGSCPFSKKSLNSQKSGAKATFVFDIKNGNHILNFIPNAQETSLIKISKS